MDLTSAIEVSQWSTFLSIQPPLIMQREREREREREMNLFFLKLFSPAAVELGEKTKNKIESSKNEMKEKRGIRASLKTDQSVCYCHI